MSHTIQEEVESVIPAMGYHLVELNIGSNRKTVFVVIYIYKNIESQITNEDCNQIILALRVRIESLIYPQHLSLSVSSPGLNRILKSQREYPIFVGRNVSVTLNNGITIKDQLIAADENTFTVGGNSYTYDQIAKGRLLDY